jgi:hypothetical protein
VPEIETEKLARDRRVSWFWVQVKTSIHMYVGCHEQYCTGINLRIPHCLTTPAAILMRRSRASTNWNSSQFQCALSSYLFEYYTVHSGVEGTQDPWQYVPTYYAAQNPHAIINGVMLHTLHSAAPSNQRSIETYSSHLGLKTRVAQDKDLATNRHDVGNRGKEMRWKSWQTSILANLNAGRPQAVTSSCHPNVQHICRRQGFERKPQVPAFFSAKASLTLSPPPTRRSSTPYVQVHHQRSF